MHLGSAGISVQSVVFGIIAGSMVLLASSKHGMAISPDSLFYLIGAENIALGNGYSDFAGDAITHWPPGYSGLIGGIASTLRITVHQSALVVAIASSILLFHAFNICMAQLQITGRWQMGLNLMLLISNAFFSYYWIRSESMFMVMLLYMISFLNAWAGGNSKRWIYLASAGLLAGAMFDVRYAAIGFIGGVYIYLFIKKDLNTTKRALALSVFTISLAILPTIWLGSSLLGDTGGSIREFAFHPPSDRHLRGLTSTLLW